MQKIQKFGGAMFTPVLLFAFAGISVGIGTLFTTQAIMGGLAAPTSMWYKCWNVFLQGGWTVFNQLPLLFAVSLPIGMAKKQNARCCMEALVLYMTFHYFVNTILTQWGGVFGVNMNAEVGGTSGLAMIASIKTLDMGMVGALAVSGIVIYLHNRFFDTELPEWLGSFSGSTFVFMIGFFVMIPVAVLACAFWPKVQLGITAFQGFVKSAGAIGIFVFDWTERSLFYNCRMFTDGLKKGHPYGEIPPCIHVGILNFNQMISPNYYHKFSLMDEKTKEIYSRKFQFHMIELKKLKYVKEKQKKKPLYRWAKLIAAQTWEELEQESKGNKYMERALEEMIKISQDERERYLYLREEMAESDRASQIQSAQRIGRKEGEILKLISLVQKKILKNKTLPQIAEESEEDTIVIEPIYTLIKENPEAEKEEIYKMLNL